MLTRREALLRGVTTLVLIPIAARCSSSSSSSPQANVACDGVPSTSSVNGGHTHTLCVPSADLANPPAGGATYAASFVSGHAHTVSLSAEQLQAINVGAEVVVESSTDRGHSHTFAIQMAQGSAMGGGSGGPY